MTLLGAMNSAISSLFANSRSLAMIADNVANNQTYGYKSSKGVFSSLISEGSQSKRSYNSGGVECLAYRRIDRTYPPQVSDSPTHMMIDGRGFFITSRTTDLAAPDFLYTRAGDFSFDLNGHLVNHDGSFLQGWQLDRNGNPVQADGVTPVNQSTLGDLSPVTVGNLNGVSRMTTQIALSANVPSDIPGLDGATQQLTSLRVYDSLGAPHDLTFNWQKTVNSPLTWTVAIAGEGGDVIRKTNGTGDIIGRPAAGGTSPITIVFDANGNPATFDGNANPPNIFATWAGTAAATQTMTLNLGTVGQSNGITSKAGVFQNTKQFQDGVKLGNFTGVSTNDQGIINALFDNGESIPVWKIPLAVFPDPNSLTLRSGTSYVPNVNSGDPIISPAKQGVSGTIIPCALEGSSVDLAGEFTNMILTQRSYSAASKVVTTTDEMFEVLERIKR